MKIVAIEFYIRFNGRIDVFKANILARLCRNIFHAEHTPYQFALFLQPLY